MSETRTIREAAADPTSTLSKKLANASEQMQRNADAIAQWEALGYTREEAYKAALYGFRK